MQNKLPLINSAHGTETRNIINELIKLFNGMGYTYNEALQKAHDTLNEAQRTNRLNNDTNARLDKIIADSGTSSTEVVDSRGEYTLLGERLNAEFSKNNTLQSEFIKDLAIINPQHLSKWRNKRARMLDENVKAKIAFWGDSITEGYYATDPLTLEAKRTKTFVGLLNQYYKNNVGDTGIGYAQTMVSGTTDNLSEWHWDSGFIVRQDTFTRTSIRSSTIGSTATLPFNGNGIDIVLIKARFYGNARIFIDDTLIKTVDLEGLTTEQEIHIESLRNFGNGNHTLKIEHFTGSYLSIIGALPIKGSKGVVTMNFARSGDTTARLIDQTSVFPNNTKTSLGLFNPDVVCIAYHTNDAGHNTGISEYISRLSYFVDKALENGSEVILIAQSIQRGMNNLSKNVIYRNAMRSVADEKGVCMIDYTGKFLYGDEVEKVGGFLYDSDHYNAKGHEDMFEIIKRVLEQ